MTPQELKNVVVVGVGIMGSQIAEIFSRVGGYRVCLADLNEELARKGLRAIEDRLERYFVAQNRLSPGGMCFPSGKDSRRGPGA